MATITTRAGKGSPLTNTEVDDNFTNLNTDKAELSGSAFTGNISTTGILGVGTTSPNFETHIHEATADADARIQLTNADTGTGTGNGFHIIMNGTTAGKQVNLLNREASPLALWTNNTERMRIDSSGNVLVGRTSDAFQVEGLTLRHSPITNASLATFTRDSSNVAAFNRLTDDGSLVTFYKDSTTLVGSIGTYDSRPYLASTTLGIRVSNALFPCNTSGVITDGACNIGGASGRFQDLYLSGGVHLGGTASANKLDDYEEGTWTPVLEDISGNTTTWAGQVLGYYTKIGNTVNAWYLFSSSNTAITNREYTIIRGLPFAQSIGERASVATISRVFGLTMSDSNYYSGVNGTAIDFLDLDSGNTRVTFTPTGVQQRFTGGVTYRTS